MSKHGRLAKGPPPTRFMGLRMGCARSATPHFVCARTPDRQLRNDDMPRTGRRMAGMLAQSIGQPLRVAP